MNDERWAGRDRARDAVHLAAGDGPLTLLCVAWGEGQFRRTFWSDLSYCDIMNYDV